MLHEVGASLRELLRRDALNGSDVEVSFEAPTKDWAARRNAPAIDVYLYDIREDLSRRDVGSAPVRGDDGRVLERRPPPRRFRLSYLITAWTQRPEDEHRLLSAVMEAIVRHDALPEDVLQGSLAEQDLPVVIHLGLPPPQDRSLSDIWSALGGELKASLDVVVIAPLDPGRVTAAGPPVLEAPRLAVATAGGARETRDGGGPVEASVSDAESETEPVFEEVTGGSEDSPGRRMRVRRLNR